MSIDKDNKPERARKLASEGIEIPIIAERLDVTRRTVWRWINSDRSAGKYRTSKSAAPTTRQ